MCITTYDIEFVFSFLVFDVFIYLLKATRKRAPSLWSGTVPYEDIALVCRRHNGCFVRMPLSTAGISSRFLGTTVREKQKIIFLREHGSAARAHHPTRSRTVLRSQYPICISCVSRCLPHLPVARDASSQHHARRDITRTTKITENQKVRRYAPLSRC